MPSSLSLFNRIVVLERDSSLSNAIRRKPMPLVRSRGILCQSRISNLTHSIDTPGCRHPDTRFGECLCLGESLLDLPTPAKRTVALVQ